MLQAHPDSIMREHLFDLVVNLGVAISEIEKNRGGRR